MQPADHERLLLLQRELLRLQDLLLRLLRGRALLEPFGQRPAIAHASRHRNACVSTSPSACSAVARALRAIKPLSEWTAALKSPGICANCGPLLKVTSACSVPTCCASFISGSASFATS